MLELSAPIDPADRASIEFHLFETEELHPWIFFDDVVTGEISVQGIFETEEAARQAWDDLVEQLAHPPSFKLREVSETDWKDSYKEHFQPWTIGALHWVPVWLKDEYALPQGHEAVWLDPGMAFGTGNHETTRLCVERLLEVYDEYAKDRLKSLNIIDAGCGSGILAISACKLGFGSVAGFDNDPDAVRIARENAAENQTPEALFAVADLVSGFKGQAYDVVLANILAVVLIEYRAQIAPVVAPGGALVLSGILAKEAQKVKEAFAPLRDWTSIQIHELGEWSSVTLRL